MPSERRWSVIGHSDSLYVSRLDNGPAYRAFDSDQAHALADTLNLVAGLRGVVRRLDEGWQIVEDEDGQPCGWYLESGMDDIDISGDDTMTPDEVAALVSVRRENDG
jgi:hypothetical protein